MASPPTSNDNTPGPDTPAEVAEVVRHTDSGAGASQAEHWPTNVEGPSPSSRPQRSGEPGPSGGG